MVDNTPYIFVDNQKIAPLRRVSKTEPLAAEIPDRHDRPFGIVDRVTISTAAKEKYRQSQTSNDVDLAAFTPVFGKPRVSTIALLTGALKRNT